jgi:hypothetical protein
LGFVQSLPDKLASQLGFERGWLNVSNQGVQTDAEKFKQDKEAFGKSAGEKATVLKDQIASCRTGPVSDGAGACALGAHRRRNPLDGG